jgi:thiol-disulfide isomerase/thioredoxin
MQKIRLITLAAVVVVIVGSIIVLENGKVAVKSGAEVVEVVPARQAEPAAPAPTDSQTAAPTTTENVLESAPQNQTQNQVTSNPAPNSSIPKQPQTTPSKNVAVLPSSQFAAQEFISPELKKQLFPLAKEITTPDGFINTSGPVSVSDYIGKKVILVDFWTYSCINCQRTTPYLNAWYEKYKDDGLVILGVHTPEFEFEKKYENVAAAAKKFGIEFPIILDNDFSTWAAYKNNYWPRKYLIDIDGYIVYDHIGEGAYVETEQKIQQALAERAAVLSLTTSVDASTVSITPKQTASQSPEIYFGALRNSALANGSKNTVGEQTFEVPNSAPLNNLYLGGTWNITDEYAEGVDGSKIVFTFKSKKVYFVADSSGIAKTTVLLDGKTISKDDAGSDVTVENNTATLSVADSRLYEVVDLGSVGEHTLEIVTKDVPLQAYTFTFE